MSSTRHHALRKLLLIRFLYVALPSLTVGLLTPGVVFAHGPAGDRNQRTQQVERTAAADPRVIVSACTLSGSFTVRGWDRKEVRVRIGDGVEIDLTRMDQTKSEPATELRVTSKGRHPSSGAGCLIGVGNGDPSSHESDRASSRKLFNGLALAIVQSDPKPGDINVVGLGSRCTRREAVSMRVIWRAPPRAIR